MSRRSHSTRTTPRSLPMIAAFCAVAGLLALAQQSWGEEKKEKLTAEERIEKALEQPTAFDFEEESLQGVVSYLRELHDIPIVLDKRALGDEGLDPETPCTLGVKQVKLRSALNHLLHALDLTYEIRNEMLIITTVAAARERLDTRVYAVGELVGKNAEKLESLAVAVATCVAPQSWSEAGGPGRIRYLAINEKSVLIVWQSNEVHGKIEALLDKLRAAIKKE